MVHLEAFADRLDFLIEDQASNVSGGERQRRSSTDKFAPQYRCGTNAAQCFRGYEWFPSGFHLRRSGNHTVQAELVCRLS